MKTYTKTSRILDVSSTTRRRTKQGREQELRERSRRNSIGGATNHNSSHANIDMDTIPFIIASNHKKNAVEVANSSNNNNKITAMTEQIPTTLNSCLSTLEIRRVHRQSLQIMFEPCINEKCILKTDTESKQTIIIRIIKRKKKVINSSRAREPSMMDHIPCMTMLDKQANAKKCIFLQPK